MQRASISFNAKEDFKTCMSNASEDLTVHGQEKISCPCNQYNRGLLL